MHEHQNKLIRKQNLNLKTPSTYSSFLAGLNFTPNFLYLLPLSGTKIREWGLQSVHRTSWLLLLPPQVGLLTAFCSSVRFLPWETILHELLPYEFFPQPAGLHSLLQWETPQGNSSCQKICSSIVSSDSIAPQVLPGACIIQDSHGVTSFLGCTSLL